MVMPMNCTTAAGVVTDTFWTVYLQAAGHGCSLGHHQNALGCTRDAYQQVHPKPHICGATLQR